MKQTTIRTFDADRDGASSRELALPLFLTTLSTLVLELALTRLFSVVLFYHYAFLVISLALLGLASGAIIARMIPRDLSVQDHRHLMGVTSLLCWLSLFPALHLILNTNIWLVNSWSFIGQLSILYLACLLPFALAGFVIAAIMNAGAERIARLYSWDLLGASCGCLFFVPLIGWLGGPSTVLLVGAFWCLSATIWFRGTSSSRWVAASLVACLVTLALVVLNGDGRFFDVRFMRGQPMKDEVFAKWNSFSRISVHRDKKGFHWIEIDGGAGTWIPDTDLSGDVIEQKRASFGNVGPEVAMWLADQPNTLIIGTGGGLDILRAIVAESRAITAVEINPIIANDLMRGRFHDYSNGLYGCREKPPEPGCVGKAVTVHVEDGRSFVQRTSQRFDVIQLAQVDTWASTASGAYGLTENYLYTVEALQSYLGRLSDNGILSISRWEFERPRETLRVLSVAIEALQREGIEKPADHVLVLLDKQADTPSVRFGTVLVQRTPFSPDQVTRIAERTRSSATTIAYAPGYQKGEPTFRKLATTTDRAGFYAAYEFDVRPVIDDRPFFFFTDRLSGFFHGLYAGDGDAMSSSAQHMLVVVLLLSLLSTVAFVFGPLLIFRSAFPPTTVALPSVGFCLAVGLGFILVEITLIHRFVVFLGQPVYSLTVVIFILLLSGGLGSRYVSGLEGDARRQRGSQAMVAIAILTVAAALALPAVTHAAQAYAMPWKIALVVAITGPLGFLMGIPFPAGLGLLVDARRGGIEWAWAINASGTVLGSTLSMIASVNFGLTTAMLSGAACYLAGVFALQRLARRDASEPVAGTAPTATEVPRSRIEF